MPNDRRQKDEGTHSTHGCRGWLAEDDATFRGIAESDESDMTEPTSGREPSRRTEELSRCEWGRP